MSEICRHTNKHILLLLPLEIIAGNQITTILTSTTTVNYWNKVKSMKN
jgi:hypothetical protein